MRKFLDAFELTVAQQRVVIVLLLVFVAAMAAKSFWQGPVDRRLQTPAVQPSPSPGTGP